MKRKIFLLCLVVLLMFQGCGEKHMPAEPDVVSSLSMNRDQYLTVVANCDEIEDKDEFAWKLIKMCQENSFHTIKFSTDRGYSSGLSYCNEQRKRYAYALIRECELYRLENIGLLPIRRRGAIGIMILPFSHKSRNGNGSERTSEEPTAHGVASNNRLKIPKQK